MKKTEKDTNLSFAKKMDTTSIIILKKQREGEKWFKWRQKKSRYGLGLSLRTVEVLNTDKE